MNTPTRLLSIPVLAILVLAIQGCSSGSGGSDVGGAQPLGPVAIAKIVGHPVGDVDGTLATTVRAGAEVILAGAFSYGRDGPILEYDWTPTNAAAEDVELLTRTSSTKSFTAPTVAEPALLTFELTVTDANGRSHSADVAVDVEPIPDQNRFLTYLSTPRTFDVTASTSQLVAADVEFEAAVSIRAAYTDRQGLPQQYEAVVATQNGTWLASAPPDPSDRNAYGNPTLTFAIPRLDLDDVNAAYMNLPSDDRRRNRMLDAFKVDAAVVDVIVSLSVPGGTGGNPADAVLFLTDAAGGDVLAKSGSECLFDGTAQRCVIPIENLGATAAAAPSENALTAAAYYDTIDPTGAKRTLTDWLRQNCFDPQARDYGADAHALYTNNYDLGFGRDMYLKSGSNCAAGPLRDGDLASVVVNYPSLLLAGKGIDPIVAVAMEYTAPAADPAAERFVKFYVFAPDEGSGEMVRVGSANFDGRGERFVPGVCTVCHGGRPPQGVVPGQPYPDHGDVGATFMAWDLDSFLFSGPDGDPQKDPSLPPSTQPLLSSVDLDVLATYTRANQEEAFRKLNEAVLATYPPDALVRRLVHDWYADGTSPPDYSSNVLTGTFRSHHVPPGWDVDVPGNSVQPRELYLKVVAQHCRACHTQLPATPDGEARIPGETQDIPTFESYQSFIAEMTDEHGMPTDRIIAPVFDDGVMPLARLTADRLWVPAASGERPADLLAGHLGLGATRVPGRPWTRIRSDKGQYLIGDDVRLDGRSDSRFAERYDWRVEHSPGSETCPNPGSPPVSSARLVGQGTPSPAFRIDVPGDYTVMLTIDNAEGRSFTAEPLIIEVENPCPVAVDLATSIALGETGATLDLNALGIATHGDPPQSIELVAQANVQVSIDDGVATFSCGAGCAQTTPSYFDFRIVDATGDYDVGRVSVTVTAAPQPTALPVTVSTIARTPTFSAGTVLDTLAPYDATGGGIGERTISVANPSTAAGGSVTVLGDGRTLRYQPPEGFVGVDTFTYTVTDSNAWDPQSASALATVEVDGTIVFDNDIYSGLLVYRGCASACHGGTDPTAQSFFDQSGNAASVWPDAVVEISTATRDGTGAEANLLFWPPNDAHFGSAYASGFGGPASACADDENADDPYCVLLRWQEEGACRIQVTGQPILGTACPAH